MRALVSAAFWWIVLLVLWLLFVGAFSKEALYAGALAALLSVGLGAVLGRLGLHAFALDDRLLAQTLLLPWYLVRDFALVTWALAHGRPSGEFVAYPFPTQGPSELAAGRRALMGAAGTITPNAYAIDVDGERGLVLMHVLDVKRAKGEPL